MSKFTAWLAFSAYKAEAIVCIWSYFPTLSESTCVCEGHVIKRWDEKRICSLESYKAAKKNSQRDFLCLDADPKQTFAALPVINGSSV